MLNIKNKRQFEEDYFILYPILIASIVMVLVLYKNFDLIVMSFLLALGFGLIFYYGKIIYKVYDTLHWIETSAEIENIEVEVVTIQDRWIKTKLYYPLISYKFKTNDEVHLSSRFSIIDDDFPFDEIHNIKIENKYFSKDINEIPIGSKIQILVNPKNSSESVIKEFVSKDKLTKLSFLFFVGLFDVIYTLYYIL